MDELGAEALRVAHEAKNLAIKALAVSEQVASHLTSINTNIEGMRRENTQQHTANAVANKANADTIHSRISSIKEALDEKISGVNEKNSSKWDGYRDKIISVLIIGAIGLLLNKLGVQISWTGIG